MEGYYLFLKTLHIIAAILFVGNIFVTALWKLLADRTRNPLIVAFAQRLVLVTDLVFTLPGALLLLLSGLMAGMTIGPEFLSLPWIHIPLSLFVVGAILWAAVLVPIQLKQSRLARDFASGGAIPERYFKLGRTWLLVGGVVNLLTIAAAVVMVLKPA